MRGVTLMVKIMQYGEGNFLRTFVDVYFDTLNKNGEGSYAVNIVKPITFGSDRITSPAPNSMPA